jgi:hypothetical protein
MKFYKDKVNGFYYWIKIVEHKLTAIHCDKSIRFIKNGQYHNSKNLAFIRNDGYKEFCLNNKCYHDGNYFTKKSWRKFVKLQVFL